jgi:hypothetical protein
MGQAQLATTVVPAEITRRYHSVSRSLETTAATAMPHEAASQ